MIEIKTKKIIAPGITGGGPRNLGACGKARQIVSVKILSLEELPVEYKESYPFCCISCGGGLVIQLEKYYVEHLNPGDILTEDHFQEVISWVRECAKRLREINSLRKKLEEEWQGEEITII